jgi:hypothetical protein
VVDITQAVMATTVDMLVAQTQETYANQKIPVHTGEGLVQVRVVDLVRQALETTFGGGTMSSQENVTIEGVSCSIINSTTHYCGYILDPAYVKYLESDDDDEPAPVSIHGGQTAPGGFDCAHCTDIILPVGEHPMMMWKVAAFFISRSAAVARRYWFSPMTQVRLLPAPR